MITRRSLLRRGGVGAAGAGLFGTAALPGAAAARDDEGSARSVVLVVLPLVRQDHVDAFEGGSPADTPNLNDLTGDSLRFDRTVPESMPGISPMTGLLMPFAFICSPMYVPAARPMPKLSPLICSSCPCGQVPA